MSYSETVSLLKLSCKNSTAYVLPSWELGKMIRFYYKLVDDWEQIWEDLNINSFLYSTHVYSMSSMF